MIPIADPRQYFANSSGCALSADSGWRRSLSRRAFSATSAPAAEIRSRKARSAPAFVSFFRQIRARPGKRESVEAFHKGIPQGGAVTQMKRDRLLLLLTP